VTHVSRGCRALRCPCVVPSRRRRPLGPHGRPGPARSTAPRRHGEPRRPSSPSPSRRRRSSAVLRRRRRSSRRHPHRLQPLGTRSHQLQACQPSVRSPVRECPASLSTVVLRLNSAHRSSMLTTFSLFSEREFTFTFAICYRRSVCLSVVCNVRAPSLFSRLKFLAIFLPVWYLGHPLTFTENFTEIVPGELLRRGI